MTDRSEPTTGAPTPDSDATSRMPVPEASAPTTPTAPTTPSAALTPASRASSPPPAFEHELAWVKAAPATPVVAARRPRRSGRIRWAISLLVIAVIIGTSAAVAALIAGRSSTSTVLAYVPEDSIMYGEVRLDLPGDQRRAVGEFLSRFPGFADQAALNSKLDEVLDNLVRDATKNEQSYSGNIKPWFDGELAFSVGPLPAAAALDGPSAMGSLRALALMSIKDPATAQAWFDGAIAKSGAKSTTETYNGTTLTVFAESGGVKAAFALLGDKVAVAGDLVSVKASVDTKGDGAFAATTGPKAAIDAGSGDHVGFMYVAMRPLLDWSNDASKAIAKQSGMPMAPLGAALLKSVPDWGAYWLRLEADAIIMETVAPKTETPIGPVENRTSTIVEHVPGTAVVSATTNEFGKTLKGMIDLYRSEPAYKEVVDQLDQALGLVGGADAAFGWAGDTAMVVTVADGTPEFGLVVAPTDRAAADRLFTSLRTFIALGGGQQGISIRDETYNGSTITIVDLGDIAKLTGMSGFAIGVPQMAGHIEIAYAITDDVVVLGSGPSFVKHVLDTTKDTSLASSERYRKLADRAGSGTGTTFVDITAIRGLIEKAAGDLTGSAGSAADAAGMAKYEKDIKPFLAPFDAIVASGSVNGDMTRQVIYITVR